MKLHTIYWAFYQRLHRMGFAFQITCIAISLVFASSTPSWSALVFSAFHQGVWKIYLQTNLQGPPKLVADGKIGDQNSPSLSPDGERAACEIQDRGLYVCTLDSSKKCQIVKIARTSGARPTWHPKTNEIIFAHYLTDQKNEESDIFTTQRALTTSIPLITQTGLQDYPDISTNGRLLTYTSASTISPYRGGVQVIQQLWIMDLQTGVARQLMLGNAQDTQPDWAPSGEMLAFTSNRTGQFEIWVIKADGEGLRQVTRGPGAKTWPAWSPDGKSIMFTMTKDGHQRLWIIDADGSNLRQFEPFGPGSDVDVRDADWR